MLSNIKQLERKTYLWHSSLFHFNTVVNTGTLSMFHFRTRKLLKHQEATTSGCFGAAISHQLSQQYHEWESIISEISKMIISCVEASRQRRTKKQSRKKRKRKRVFGRKALAEVKNKERILMCSQQCVLEVTGNYSIIIWRAKHPEFLLCLVLWKQHKIMWEVKEE